MGENHSKYKSKVLLVKYKGGKCAICGYNKCIEAFDFHHVDPKLKEFSISDAMGKGLKQYPQARLEAEADKCLMLCANCHREIYRSKYSLSQDKQQYLMRKKC